MEPKPNLNPAHHYKRMTADNVQGIKCRVGKAKTRFNQNETFKAFRVLGATVNGVEPWTLNEKAVTETFETRTNKIRMLNTHWTVRITNIEGLSRTITPTELVNTN